MLNRFLVSVLLWLKYVFGRMNGSSMFVHGTMEQMKSVEKVSLAELQVMA